MRELLIFGAKTFKITIPDEAKVTFGPWSPATAEAKYAQSEKALNGTLRVYETAKAGAGILAVFSGVTGFRNTELGYSEEVAREEGAVIWKSDRDGYQREEKVKTKRSWVVPELEAGETDDEETDEPA